MYKDKCSKMLTFQTKCSTMSEVLPGFLELRKGSHGNSSGLWKMQS